MSHETPAEPGYYWIEVNAMEPQIGEWPAPAVTERTGWHLAGLVGVLDDTDRVTILSPRLEAPPWP